MRYPLERYLRAVISSVLMIIGRCGVSGQLYINEFMASNSTIYLDVVYNAYSDWIELYNSGSEPVNLAGYYLTDDMQQPLQWQFPEGITITAGSYLIVWADNQGLGNHTNFKLSSEGEQIALYDKSSVLIDSVSFGPQSSDISFGRKTDGASQWNFFSQPTPNLANNLYTQSAIAPAPQFSPVAGFYGSSQTIIITNTAPDVNIRYTLDGTTPTASSTLYTTPLNVSSTSVVTAKAFGTDYIPSPSVSQTYFINAPGHELPVISLSTTPANLWDNTIGIYVEGTNGIPGYCLDYPVNWNQDWERPVSMEFFNTHGDYQFQQNAGTKIYGGCSRTAAQKSLAIIARNEYGNNRINYKFFDDKHMESFKSIVLRNSGNDNGNTILRDAFMQYIVKDQMDVDYQAYQPAVIYINGEYWGIQNIREKINEHYVSNNKSIDPDDINLLEMGGNIVHGDNQQYVALLDYLANNSLTSDENYGHVKTQIDIDEYINYMITEIFVGNTDWPGNNVKYWRPASAFGQWRWILFDLDFGFGIYGFQSSDNTLAFALETNGPDWPNPPWSTFLFRKMVENEEFKNVFIQRFAHHLNTTFQPERMITLLDSMASVIAPEVPRHAVRWGAPYDYASWEGNLQVVRDFGRQRPAFVRQHIQSVFGVSGSVQVIVSNPDTAAGCVWVNSIPVIDTLFSGEYFRDIPLLLQVSLHPGYGFSHWDMANYYVTEDILVPGGSEWKYLDDGTNQGTGWYAADFNDSSWNSGPAQLGYGDGDENTTLDYGPDENNKYITSYFRKAFNVNEPVHFDKVLLRLLRDDGAIVYLNGEEIVRSNMPAGAIDYLTPSTTFVGDEEENAFFEFTVDTSLLDTGINVLAVELHQTGPTSSDISFNLELSGTSYDKGEENTLYNYPLELAPDQDIFITPVFEPAGIIDSLFINEMMAENVNGYMDNKGQYEDWIEVYNGGSKPVNIAGLYFTDDMTNPAAWKVPFTNPDITTIQPGEFMVLWADDDTTQGPLHLGFKLDNDGENVGIFQSFNEHR